MPNGDDSSTAFKDFSGYFDGLVDRAWEVGTDSDAGDPKTLLTDMWALWRALSMGPAGIPLLFSPKNREMLHRMLYIYGLVDQRDDKNHDELKGLTKDLLLTWLELGDEARRHRNELWRINKRLMEKFGEAIDDVTAELSRRRGATP